MDRTLYTREKFDNPSIRLYVNKIENRITFKTQRRYYLELLTPKTMKLLESTEKTINKNRKGENAPHLQITKVVHCHISIMIIKAM